jgi:hypothetical protein
MQEGSFWELTVIQLVKEFPLFTETDGSLPCLQQPAIGSYPESDASGPHHPTLISLRSILILFSNLLLGLRVVSSFRVLRSLLCMHFSYFHGSYPCAFNSPPRHEGILEELRYSSTHSLTSALDGGEWLVSRPSRYAPWERAPGTHCIGWLVPRAGLESVVKKIPSPCRDSNHWSSSP